MTSTIEREQNGTITLTIQIPWDIISHTKEEVVLETIKTIELPGFRKGKVPRKIAEEKINTSKVYEDVIQKILPHAYAEAVKQHELHPIIVPKVEMVEAKEGSNWIIKAHTCEKPKITLGDYKEAIKAAKTSKRNKIWTPGDAIEKPQPEEEKQTKQMALAVLLESVLTAVTCQIPDLLADTEVNRQLSDLVDQTKKLGLSVDQYLASTNRTPGSVRAEYETAARRTLTLEFALEAIADREAIFVSDDDIENTLKATKSEEERKALSNERYYLASILRRQKTLDFLAAV